MSRRRSPGRPVGVMLGADTALNPFSIRPSYQALLKLPVAERMRAPAGPGGARRDPGRRAVRGAADAAVASSASTSPAAGTACSSWATRRTTSRRRARASPPSPSAKAAPRTRWPTTTSPTDPANFLFFPVTGYNVDNHDVIRTMLTDDGDGARAVGDGGAHCSSIIDAGVPTWMLTHWARDRSRGPRLPLEFVVKRQTSETARLLRLPRPRRAGGRQEGRCQRHRLRPACGCTSRRSCYDLPAGGRRLVQRVDGYNATFVSGVPIFEQGAHTGALPGRLVRAGH